MAGEEDGGLEGDESTADGGRYRARDGLLEAPGQVESDVADGEGESEKRREERDEP
jgi:hypothetical protein